MSIAFQIPSLPPKGFEKNAKNRSFQELFWISTGSTKSFNSVKNAVLLFPADKKLVLNVTLAASSYVEFCWAPHTSFARSTWNFYGKRDPKRFGIESRPTRTVNLSTRNGSLTFWKESKKCYGCVAASDSVKDLLQFLEHVANLFDGTTTENLKISTERSCHLESIQSFDLLRKIRCVEIKGGTLDHDAMRRVLTGFEAPYLEFSCSVDANFNFQDIPAFEDTVIIIRALFDNPMRLAYKFDKLDMGSCEMPHEDVYDFFRHWKDSYSRVPQEIILYRNTYEKESDGIYDNKWTRRKNWKQDQWNPTQIDQLLREILEQEPIRDKSCWYERWNFKRRTDGMMLSVWANTTGDFSEMDIRTWYE